MASLANSTPAEWLDICADEGYYPNLPATRPVDRAALAAMGDKNSDMLIAVACVTVGFDGVIEDTVVLT